MPVMSEIGKAVHEERVVETMLSDLARSQSD
jgi:hypothetical protein